MSKHACLRCGHLTRCGHGSWVDRNPWPFAFLTLTLGTFGLAAVCAYPFVLVPVLAVAALAYRADREHRRRRALAARADSQHAALLAAQARAVRRDYRHYRHLTTARTAPIRKAF